MATTGQQIADFVRGQLLEPVAGFFTDAELLGAINNFEADFFGWVHGKESILESSTVAGQQIYELPGGVVSLKKVFLNVPGEDGEDNWTELTPTTLEKLSQEHPNWLSDSEVARDTPVRYMLYDESLYLHPVPDEEGLELKVFHFSVPDPLESLSDPLNIDDGLVDGAKAYVLWKAWEKDKEPERAAVEQATYKAYLGKGRRFYNRRMGGLRRRLDADSSTGFTRNGE